MRSKHEFEISETNPQNNPEVDAIVEMTMRTVLETIPEFENSEKKVLNTFANFTFPQMHAMIVADFPKPNYLSLIAHSDARQVIGHLLCSVKLDQTETPYGYLFSMFVEPCHRRRGVGSALVMRALDWFAENKADYVRGETHAHNFALQKLAAKFGFTIAERKQSHWPVLMLIRNKVDRDDQSYEPIR